MRGRLGNKEIVISEDNQKAADKWLQYIGKVYDEYLIFFSNGEGMDEASEKLNTTILNCYDAIRRNGLKDDTEQGMKNYLYRAYQTNKWALKVNDKYTKRRELVDDDTLVTYYDNTIQEDTEEKITKQLYDDFRAVYLVTMVEENMDRTDSFCWRVKHFVPNATYKNISKITNTPNAKSRVIRVNKWLKENIDNKAVMNAFKSYMEDGIVRINDK